MPELPITVITASHLFDGTHRQAVERGVIVIRGEEITAVGIQGQVDVPTGPGVKHLDLPGTVLPGLIDVHTHLVLRGDAMPPERMMDHEDGLLLLQAAANAKRALWAGITTLADMGARNRVTFTLRDSLKLGLEPMPRLVLSGRPVTIKGGHCGFFNGEVEGPGTLRETVEQLVREGADVIKVMVTGGGTLGTDPYATVFSSQDLAKVTQVARTAGKKTAAHCNSAAGISRALDASFDMIFHANQYEPDGQLCFQADLARRLAQSSSWVNPTLMAARIQADLLRVKGNRLTPEERQILRAKEERYRHKVDHMNRLVRAGVKMIAGSDAGWGPNPFGDLVLELEEMVAMGMQPADVVLAATRDAAQALGVGQLVGTLEPGKKADLLDVAGDPTRDISALRVPRLVMLGGQIVQRN